MAAEDVAPPTVQKLHRSEKKARKVLGKLGLIPQANIMRVTIKKSKDVTMFNQPRRRCSPVQQGLFFTKRGWVPQTRYNPLPYFC